MQAAKILIVEDEQAIADTLIYALGSNGFAVRHVLLGGEVLPTLREWPADLIILDIGLPDTSGFEVLRALRATVEGHDVPVIFLTARADEIDRVLGLELGADDYVTKPFSPREVAARARAVLRRETRFRKDENSGAGEPTIWQHDPAALRICFRGQGLDLTHYEYRLLALLLSAPGRVFTREQIMSRVWSRAPDTADRSIDTHIKTLRAKLRSIDPAGEPIVTHRSSGYSLAP